MSSLPDFSALGAGAITASLVVDHLGSAQGALGNSHGIGNETDRQLLLWLRSNAEVVLTSGATAIAEDYKMPSSCDLAILTRQPKGSFSIDPRDRRLIFMHGGYFEGVNQLQELGYQRIHTEFGPTGFIELSRRSEVDCYLSSKGADGVDQFVSKHELAIQKRFELPDLLIAKVAGRGRA